MKKPKPSDSPVSGTAESKADVSTPAVKELRASRDRLNRTQEIAHLGSWELDLSKNRLSWSDEVYRIFGLTPQEAVITYETFLAHIHPEDRAAVDEAYTSSVRDGKDAYEIEHRLIRPESGEIRWVQEKCVHERDTQGKIQRSTGMVLDITDRRRAEEELRQSAEKYQRLFQNMADGFALYELLYDPQGQPVDWRILEINEAYTRHTGVEPRQIVGRRISELYPPALQKYLPLFAQVVQTQKPIDFKTYAEYVKRHQRVIAFPVGGPRFACIVEDITKQIRAEEDHVRLTAIVESSENAIITKDMNGLIQSWNPGAEKLFGYVAEEILGQPLVRLLPSERAREEDEILRRLQQGEATAQLESVWLTKAGRRMDVSESISLLKTSGGKVFGTSKTVRDITALKQAEAVLKRSRDELDQLVQERTAELAESEQKYRELVESVNSVILRVTPQFIITFFNEYAESFFGYAKADVLGKSVLDTIIPQNFSEENDLRAMMRNLALHPELHSSHENENIRKDGTRVWIHWSNRAIFGQQGQVAEILSVGTDITERKRMQAENERFQMRLRALSERLAISEEQERWNISRYIHDTIIQNLSLASMRLGSAQKALAEAGHAQEIGNLQKTRLFVDDAIAECRTVMSELTPALLYELGLVPALRDLAERTEQRHGIRVGIAEEGQSRKLDAPLRGLLFQSARELIMNSVKHAGPCEIRVRVVHAPSEVQICIQDNGKGFEPDGQDESNSQADGFGLLNVRQRVEGMGGRLTIVSVPGKGTTASILLLVPDTP